MYLFFKMTDMLLLELHLEHHPYFSHKHMLYDRCPLEAFGKALRRPCHPHFVPSLPSECSN